MVYIIGSNKAKDEQIKSYLDDKISRRDFLKYMGATAASAYLAACNPEPPEPPQPNYIKLISSGNATETLSNSPMTGTMRFIGSAYDLGVNNKPYLKNFDVEMPFGEQAYLGMMPEGQSAYYEMDFMANDALKRIFKQVAMSGTNDYQTDVLKLSGFNYDGMRQYMTGYGTVPEYVTNKRWNVDHLDVSFNPNRTTGETLPQDYIDQVKSVILKMFSNSGGFIKSYSFSNENKPEDSTVPPDGQIWVFCSSDLNGTGGIDYPISGDQVKSAKLMANPINSHPLQFGNETYNIFLQGVNDISAAPNNDIYVDNWYRSLFKRRIDVKFYGDREEQNGFTGNTNYLGKTRVMLTEDLGNKLPDMTNVFGTREATYNKREFTEKTPEKRSKEKRILF